MLHRDFDMESANAVVDAVNSAVSTISDLKSEQAKFEDKIREFQIALYTAKTQAEIDNYNSWIAYYQYISDALQEIIEKREIADRRNNIKRVVIFGGAIAVALFFSYSAYKKK